MDSQTGKTVFIVSTRALKELEDRFLKHLSLEMSWSDAPHEVGSKANSMGAGDGDCCSDAACLPGAAAGPSCRPLLLLAGLLLLVHVLNLLVVLGLARCQCNSYQSSYARPQALQDSASTMT